MPSNISQLKNGIKKRFKNSDVKKASMQLTVDRVVLNLARFTNVDDGILAGGWTVVLNPSQKIPTLMSGGDRKGLPTNKTRLPSLKNGQLISRITGNKDVVIGNNIFYAGFVNNGTRRIRPFKFMERSVATARQELSIIGIKTEVSSG